MRPIVVFVVTLAVGCNTAITPRKLEDIRRPILNESFDDLTDTAHRWVTDSPGPGSSVSLIDDKGNRCISLELADGLETRELSFHRAIDVASVRGQRLRVSVRVRQLRSGHANLHLRV